MKLRARNDEVKETDINARGCDIDEASLKEFYGKLDQIKDGDYLILAGSIPESLPSDSYESILAAISDRKVNCVIDASQDLLRNTLKYHPFFIKPNKEELGEIFGVSIRSREDVLRFAKELQQEGARNILVSMGSEGGMLLSEDGACLTAPKVQGTTVNTVGAGDSMVAGFLAGWIKYSDFQKALNLGTAAGSATAFSEGIASRKDILKTYENL